MTVLLSLTLMGAYILTDGYSLRGTRQYVEEGHHPSRFLDLVLLDTCERRFIHERGRIAGPPYTN